jgi:hypothetical protein
MTELEIAKVEYHGRMVDRKGKKCFPVLDIIKDVTDTNNPRQYWDKMKIRDLAQIEPFWFGLKVLALDGKIEGNP